VVLALAYVLHPAVHGANLYEFHSLTLLGTPLLWGLYFLERESAWGYYPLLCVILLVREDAALLMCFVAGYAILTGRPRRARLGWVTLAASLGYFYVVKAYFMPSPDLFNQGPESLGFAYYYRELTPKGEGFAGFVTSVLLHPAYAIEIALREDKLVYLATLLLPLGLLPLWARPGRFMMLYGLVFLLLATKRAVYSTAFQYSMLLVPVLFAVAPAGLERLERWAGLLGWKPGRRALRAGVCGAVVVAAVLSSWKFGGIVENAAFRGGFKSVVRELDDRARERYAKLRELVDMIPPEARVEATGRLGAHASNRMSLYRYRHRKKDAEYALVDEQELRGDLRSWHEQRKREGRLELVADHQSFKLYKVVQPKDSSPSP